jgi:hypothetical protein
VTELEKRLRELAGKATQDERIVYLGHDRFSTNPGCYGAYIEVGNRYNFLASGWSDADKEFFCEANPTTVTALLDALAAAREELEIAAKSPCTAHPEGSCPHPEERKFRGPAREALAKIDQILEGGK